MKKLSLVILVLSLLIRVSAYAASSDPVPDAGEESAFSALKALKTSDERTHALKELADHYLSVNRLDRAVNAYRSVINDANISSKDKYYYYSVIAGMYLDANQYSSAMEYYQEAVNVLPKLEEARLRLAGVYELSDLNELAKLAYLDDLKVNKKSFEANFGLAALYMKMGLNTQAMEYFRRTLTIKADPNVYRKTALCAETAGDVTIACAMLRQIPSEQRTYGDLISLGRLYAESGRKKDAEESFSLAINKNTENIEGYIDLALLYLDNNDLVPAEKLLLIALEKAPGEGSAHFFLGCIYSAQKRYELARLEMKKASALAKTPILKGYSLKFQKYISSSTK